jgi:hypothetical protein
MLNAGLVNEFRLPRFSQKKTRFRAISPENMRFKNPVKYSFKPAIHETSRETAPPPERRGTKIIQRKHNVRAFNVSLRRFLLRSPPKERRRGSGRL